MVAMMATEASAAPGKPNRDHFMASPPSRAERESSTLWTYLTCKRCRIERGDTKKRALALCLRNLAEYARGDTQGTRRRRSRPCAGKRAVARFVVAARAANALRHRQFRRRTPRSSAGAGAREP